MGHDDDDDDDDDEAVQVEQHHEHGTVCQQSGRPACHQLGCELSLISIRILKYH